MKLWKSDHSLVCGHGDHDCIFCLLKKYEPVLLFYFNLLWMQINTTRFKSLESVYMYYVTTPKML